MGGLAEGEPTQVASVAEEAAQCSNLAAAAWISGQGSLRKEGLGGQSYHPCIRQEWNSDASDGELTPVA